MTKRDQRKHNYFVLDGTVLIHDSNSPFAFKNSTIVIPFTVIEQLDNYKNATGEKGRNAREVLRLFDELSKKGNIQKGVELGGRTGALLKIMPPPLSIPDICSSAYDNAILGTIQEVQKQSPYVRFITKDVNSRIKASALGIDCENYKADVVPEEKRLGSWINVDVPAKTLKEMTASKVAKHVDTKELSLNQFVVMRSENNPENAKVFRYQGGVQFRAAVQPKLHWNFEARNLQQLMALDLLLDDDIKLVSLLGPAGTGKTFLTLLAGLQKVISERTYRRFLIARPVVALGADIGFLPGDVQEKLHHWMKPIYDNLEYIFSEHNKEDSGLVENLKEKEDTKHRKRRRSKPITLSVELLEQRGIISMEAITYMRGRSIPYQFMFIDEVQNLTPHEVKTLVTRAGIGTKIILSGDPHQIDSPYLDYTSNGLTVVTDKFRGQNLFGTVYLTKSERSRLAEYATKLL